MYSDTQLNSLVSQGKNEILGIIERELSAANLGASLQSRFRLALKTEHAPLDIYRTKVMILEENGGLLSAIASGDEGFLAVMAQATGRVSQLQDCFGALQRVAMTVEPESDHAAALEAFRTRLRAIERSAVRMESLVEGLSLVPLAA